MPVRPQIDEETVERVNDKAGLVMRVDPEDAGLDTKINILLDELEDYQREARAEQVRSGGEQFYG